MSKNNVFHNSGARDIQVSEPATRPSGTVRTSIAALVPAYNEAGRIGAVLDVLSQIDELGDIIVIDDGSRDRTSLVAAERAAADRRIRLIRHPKNQGKGQAIYAGWNASKAAYILMVDADLIGLTPDHIRTLIRPVMEGKADMALGLFQGGQWNTSMSHRITPWLTGQRCFRSSLMRYVSQRAAAGYGIETALTIAARQRDFHCISVAWPGVTHPPSETHRGFWGGLHNRGRMYSQIVRAWYLAGDTQGLIARLRQWLSFG